MENTKALTQFPFQPHILRMIEGKSHDYTYNDLKRILEKEFDDWHSEIQRYHGEQIEEIINHSLDSLQRLVINELLPLNKEIYETYLKKVRELLIQENIYKSKPQKLFASISDNKLNFIYVRLTENSVFLPKNTDYNSFCYVFGNSERPTDFTRLVWKPNKQLLRELITGLKSPDIEISSHKYDLPPYFKNEKGENISYLPNNKSKQDPLSKKLKEILIKLRQTK